MTPSLSLFMAKATLRYPLRHHRPPNVRGLLRNPKSIRAFGVSRRSCVALDLEPTKYVRYGFIQDAVGHPLLARSALGAASKIDVMVLPHPDRSRHACHPLPSVTLRASVSSWTFLLDKSTVIPCQMQWGRTWTPCDAHVQCHWNAKKVSSCHVACLLCLLSLRSAIQPTLRSLLVEPSVGFFHADPLKTTIGNRTRSSESFSACGWLTSETDPCQRPKENATVPCIGYGGKMCKAFIHATCADGVAGSRCYGCYLGDLLFSVGLFQSDYDHPF